MGLTVWAPVCRAQEPSIPKKSAVYPNLHVMLFPLQLGNIFCILLAFQLYCIQRGQGRNPIKCSNHLSTITYQGIGSSYFMGKRSISCTQFTGILYFSNKTRSSNYLFCSSLSSQMTSKKHQPGIHISHLQDFLIFKTFYSLGFSSAFSP